LGEVVSLSDASLATSQAASNSIEMDGRRFSPFIDSKTGRPIESELFSVSVIMPDCASANAAATTLMASGIEKAIQLTEQQNWATLLVARRNGAVETIPSAEFQRQAKRVRKTAALDHWSNPQPFDFTR
jgi:thiamine biosynthesis lipoprotein